MTDTIQEINLKKLPLTMAERVISTISPTWALKRFQNRCRLEMAARAYEATEMSRLRKQKNRFDQRSQDQLNQISAEAIRLQARYLDENHDLAKSVLNTLVSAVVGRGIKSFPMVKDRNGDLMDDVNETIQSIFEDWAKKPEVTRENSWSQCQRLAARSWFRDGEEFDRQLIGTVSGLEHSTELQFSIQQLEADFVPMGLNTSRKNVRQGISRDSWGKPLSYFVFKSYPAELGNSNFTNLAGAVIRPIGAASSAFLDSDQFVEVNAEEMVQLKVAERINSTRGISIFTSVFNRLDDLKDYEESERIAARVGAAFALAITKTIDGGPGSTGGAEWREMDLAPGIIADNLAPGEKIETIKNERPANQISSFRENQLKAVAGGTRAGYSSTAKDYDGSYSSQRQELQEQNQVYQMIRDEFIHKYIMPHYQKAVQLMALQGLIPRINNVDPMTLFSAEHVGQGVPYIEPKREIEADILAIDNNIKSRSQVILERTGRNPRDVQKERTKEMEEDRERNPEPVAEDTPPGGNENENEDTPADEETADQDVA